MSARRILTFLLYYLALLGGGYMLVRSPASSPAVSPTPTVTPFVTRAQPPAGTFYSVVDGYLGREASPPERWQDIHDGSGTVSPMTDTQWSALYLRQQLPVNNYDILRRVILQFDTSALKDEAVIESARLEVMVNSLDDTIGKQAVVVTAAKLKTATTLQNDDYSSVGEEALSTPVPLADIEQKSILVFPLNARGIAHISRNGISQLALVFESDRANKEPPWIAGGQEAYLNIDFVEGLEPPRLIVKLKD